MHVHIYIYMYTNTVCNLYTSRNTRELCEKFSVGIARYNIKPWNGRGRYISVCRGTSRDRHGPAAFFSLPYIVKIERRDNERGRLDDREPGEKLRGGTYPSLTLYFAEDRRANAVGTAIRTTDGYE